VKTNGFAVAPTGTMEPYPCRPAVEVPREAGEVPHHGIDAVPATREFAERHGIPEEAAAGGAATALPEYMAKLPSLPMVEPKGDPNEGFGPPPAPPVGRGAGPGRGSGPWRGPWRPRAGRRHGTGAPVNRRVFLHPRVALVTATLSAAVLSAIV